MEFRVRGETIPKDLLETIAAITDRAKLFPSEVSYDREKGILRLSISRLPLLRKRRVLPNVHDRDNPITAEITIRNVVEVDIRDHIQSDWGGEITLLFGLQLAEKGIYLCSAEEKRGKPCYSMSIRLSETDLEIKDKLPSAAEWALGGEEGA